MLGCDDSKGGEPRAPDARSGATAPSAKEGEEKGKRPGLCCNCDWRESCVYPKPSGGVWFCEEYQ